MDQKDLLDVLLKLRDFDAMMSGACCPHRNPELLKFLKKTNTFIVVDLELICIVKQLFPTQRKQEIGLKHNKK